jgi:hypothetical protein
MVSSPTLAGVRASDVGVPFLPARTAGRAGLGSVIGLAIVLLWLGMTPDWIAVVVFTVALAVTLCERRWPSVRVPGGSAYGFIGGNRWAAAGIEGAVAGGTVGYAASVALRVTKEYGDELTLYAFLLHLIATGVGFVVAEAVLYSFVPDAPRAAAVPPAVIEGSIAGNPPAELSGARPPSIDVRSRTGRDASSGPFRLRTAGARAALGTLVGFAGAIVLTSIVWPSVIEETGDRLLSTLVTDAVLLVFTITLAVSLIERWSPAFRVPDGRLYGSVGRNRYAASAIEGFVAGGIVGGATSVLIAVWRNDQSQLGPMAFILPAVFAALGFVIAEAVIHALRRRPRRSNAA